MSANRIKIASLAPFTDMIIDRAGILTRSWTFFFRAVQEALYFIGSESQFTLTNNLAVAADVTEFNFEKKYISLAIIDYVIQRTSSTAQLIQTGVIRAVYQYRSDDWAIINTSYGPDVSGITFTITAAGKIQYTSTNQGGTMTLSRICFRIRRITGKSVLYSKMD